jgi:hypothetical protein
MQKNWQSLVVGLITAGSLAGGAWAASTPQRSRAGTHQAASKASSSRGGYGVASMLDKTVGLTPEQKDSVQGLLADQRQKSQALREETDAKIRAVLTPDQQKKFDELLAEQKARRANRFARAQ